MDRFAAMIWDADDHARLSLVNSWGEALRQTSSRWTNVLDAPGLRVYSLVQRGETPVVTRWEKACGVVVGPLFERGREKSGRVLQLDQRQAERIIETVGESLVKQFWGNYVAFWRDERSKRRHILRDPCGAVPCFMTQSRGIDLLFSHADDVAQLPGVQFTIDWTYLQAFVLFNYFVNKYTGLKEVVELLAGERLDLDPKGAKSFFWIWNGAEVAARPNFQPFDDAKHELRATAEACFSAWGAEYRRVVVSVSGGLDSSILLNLMRRASDTQIIGLHYLGVGYEQYEVKLARLAAAHAGVELVEAVQDPKRDEVRRVLDAPKLARPKVQSLAVLIDDLSIDLADRLDADAFMIGQGGDNLFLQRAGAKYTLADYVRLRGFGKDFWRVAYDASVLQQQSIWRLLGDTIETALLRRNWRPFEFLEADDWAQHRPFAPGALGAIPDVYKAHPWFADAQTLPHGKAEHLASIVALYNYYMHHGRGVARDVAYPYFSQPLAEFVLRTPTYILCHDGLDRALERRAFADLIPEAIAQRTGKSGADHYLLQVMAQNIDFYRELVLDGALLRQGWLVRDRIERMLAPDYAAHGGGALFVYLLVAAEAWIQSWLDDGARAAA